MSDDEILKADNAALESALKRLVKFIDPKPPAHPVLSLTSPQIAEMTAILKECYRCLWSEHPGMRDAPAQANGIPHPSAH